MELLKMKIPKSKATSSTNTRFKDFHSKLVYPNTSNISNTNTTTNTNTNNKHNQQKTIHNSTSKPYSLKDALSAKKSISNKNNQVIKTTLSRSFLAFSKEKTKTPTKICSNKIASKYIQPKDTLNIYNTVTEENKPITRNMSNNNYNYTKEDKISKYNHRYQNSKATTEYETKGREDTSDFEASKKYKLEHRYMTKSVNKNDKDNRERSSNFGNLDKNPYLSYNKDHIKNNNKITDTIPGNYNLDFSQTMDWLAKEKRDKKINNRINMIEKAKSSLEVFKVASKEKTITSNENALFEPKSFINHSSKAEVEMKKYKKNSFDFDAIKHNKLSSLVESNKEKDKFTKKEVFSSKYIKNAESHQLENTNKRHKSTSKRMLSTISRIFNI